MKIPAAIVLLLSFLTGYSQSHQIKFSHLGLEQGLSQSTVTCILQDSHGLMWFGTTGGLNKYDGYQFTVYKSDLNDSTTLSRERISEMVEDKDGNLWIATFGGGLNMFDRRQLKFTRFVHNPKNASSIPGNWLHCVTLDREGNLWIGTSGEGLLKFDPATKSFTQYKHDPSDTNSISENSVQDIVEDQYGILWISTVNKGICRFDRQKNTFQRFNHNPRDPTSLTSDLTEFLFFDSNQQLWVGTRDGLSLFDHQRSTFTTFQHDPQRNSLPGNVILSMTEDSDGNLWVGTENAGLSVYNVARKEFTNYLRDEIDSWSLSNNSIWSLYQDVTGNIWIGTFGAGINFTSRNLNTFTHYRHTSSPFSISHNSLWDIFEDSHGSLWIGTDGGGLNRFDPQTKTFTAFKANGRPTGLSGNYVLSITEDADENLWVGTWGDGITVFDKSMHVVRQHLHNVQDPNGISSSNVWALFCDSKKRVWVGTYSNGIDRYDKTSKGFVHFRHDPQDTLSLSSNTINAFFEDSKGFLWICTAHGLNRWNESDNSFTSFFHSDHENSISNDRINCIIEDASGDFWIGTELGLSFLDSGTGLFTSYFKNDGLPGNIVSGILLDDTGNLWISTNNGLASFNPTTKVFRTFGPQDGLQSYEFSKGAHKTNDGTFYFGGKNGLNEFVPAEIRRDLYDPKLVFTDFDIFNKSAPIVQHSKTGLHQAIGFTDEVHLESNQSVFTISFASLNYANPKGKGYTYMLENFDKDWSPVSSTNRVTYTNLDPGTYTFKVRGLTSDGEISSTTSQLGIKVQPSFWETLSFKILLLILLAGLVRLVFLFRTRAIRQKNLKLARAVHDATAKIEKQNRKLLEQQEEMAAQNEELLQSQEQASQQRDLLFDQNNELNAAKQLIEDQNKNLESEIANRTKELVDYSHQLEQFAYVSAHNLRAPVARILGLGQLLELNKDDLSDREFIIGRLVKTTQELDTVVRDLNAILELKKDDTSSRTRINLHEIISRVRELLEKEIQTAAATIDSDGMEIQTVVGIKPYLESILYNLISNAVKYRHPDRPPWITITSEPLGDEIKIVISDNGLGMDLDRYKEKVFSLYSRFHDHVDGKGLGLYLVKVQVEALEGRIEIESLPNQGTTFSIYFKADNTHGDT